jgi:hypothetical protein
LFRYFAIDGDGSHRPASAAKVQEFVESSEEAVELVASWGGRAAWRSRVAAGRVSLILSGMGEADPEKATTWPDNLPGPQFAAVVRAMAG